MRPATRLCAIVTFLALGLAAGPAYAVEAKDVTGAWAIDLAKSKAAPDGNTAGLMKAVTLKDDGSFEALYGTKGTWKIAGGKLLVTYQNSARKDEVATLEGDILKFPSPAMAGKFCYLARPAPKPAK